MRIRPTRAEIDLDALAENLTIARSLAGQAELLGVVKANAYGHGAIAVAQRLVRQGVRYLGVALVEEAVELRRSGLDVDILVLGGAYEGGYTTLVEHRLTPVVFRPEHLSQYVDAARAAGLSLVVAHLKVDTGMGRIGVDWADLGAFLKTARSFPELALEGLISHFANADLADASFTQEQLRRFTVAAAQMEDAGMAPRFRHLSNSAGLLSLPEARDGTFFNLVRPGLMLYGVSPLGWKQAEAEKLKPVLSWKTAITHLKEVPEGTPVSYGSTWRATRPSKIATLPVGYADGYSRHYSSVAPVLVRGKRALLAGRVCMDMCMVDVTEVPGVSVGDEVVLVGEQGAERIDVTELAQLSHSLSYEVLCSVGARVPRVTRAV